MISKIFKISKLGLLISELGTGPGGGGVLLVKKDRDDHRKS